MAKKYILSLDQGTTSSRSLLIDFEGKIVGMAQEEFEQIFPQPGWVEHDPEAIYQSQIRTVQKVLQEHQARPEEVAAIGITNQRETTVIWNKETGKPIYNAIVWQDKRTATICEELKTAGLTEYVKKTTGLVIDSYFSGTKAKWLLDEVEGARALAETGKLLFGTIDTWLIWKMTQGQSHVTDYSNASRTLLFDIHELQWDPEILKELDIPENMLPKVQASASNFGNFELEGVSIPIAGVAGDQQAALFGQACFSKGSAKNTYGTGCFMLMNTGTVPKMSENGLLTTIAWGLDNQVYYALEGSVFIAGAAIQWLRDGLQIIDSAAESETLAEQVKGENPVYVVPAFAGLGAPYWDMYARGAIFGLTRDTGKAHIAKATLESLAYQTKDLARAMRDDSGIKLDTLKVDGGACANNLLMQFQADILNAEVHRPAVIESTAMGAAFLAGIQAGIWTQDEIDQQRSIERTFRPSLEKEQRKKLYKGWKKAVKRSMKWL